MATAFPADPNRLFWWDGLWQVISQTRQSVVAYGASSQLPLVTDAQRGSAYAIISEWLKTLSPASRWTWLDLLVERLEVRPVARGGAPVLGWDELRALAQDGLVVAPHGQCHELLDQVDPETLRCEVAESRDDIVREIGHCPSLFAYPNGNFDAGVVRALGGAGYKAAFTTIGGRDALPTQEPFMLRREQAGGSLLRLAVKLTPAVAAWRTARKPLPAGRAYARPATHYPPSAGCLHRRVGQPALRAPPIGTWRRRFSVWT